MNDWGLQSYLFINVQGALFVFRMPKQTQRFSFLFLLFLAAGHWDIWVGLWLGPTHPT